MVRKLKNVLHVRGFLTEYGLMKTVEHVQDSVEEHDASSSLTSPICSPRTLRNSEGLKDFNTDCYSCMDSGWSLCSYCRANPFVDLANLCFQYNSDDYDNYQVRSSSYINLL